MPPKLGILAGQGDLPRLLIRAARDQGRDVFVIAFHNQTDPETLGGVEHAWFRLGQAGSAIKALKDAGVEDLVLAGAIDRPSPADMRPDFRTIAFIAKTGAFKKGDDGLLSAIVQALETDEGFHIVGVHEVEPELLAPAGVLGTVQPDPDGEADLHAALHAAKDLGSQDLGQAAVVLDGRVVALEDRDGTDAMLKRLAMSGDANGGVLVKAAKPGQEARADLPTIGVDTIANASAAGLRGIGVEAGAALIVNRDDVIAAADAAGLFLVGLDGGEGA